MKENQNIENIENESVVKRERNCGSEVNEKKSKMTWGAMFGIFMIFIYFGMAYLTLFTDYFFWIPDWAKYGLGFIFIFYGLWRGYRYIKS